MSPQFAPLVIRFGVFELNLAARELRRHGMRLRLSGQPFEILAFLLERPGEIVTREQLRARLWAADTFVDFEHSLNSAVKKLRQTLGDSADVPRYVETLPRVGYRFIAPVQATHVDAAEGPPAVPREKKHGAEALPSGETAVAAGAAASRRVKLFWVAGAVLLAGAIATPLLWRLTRHPAQPSGQRTVIAVLPFQNLTGDPEQEYLSDGLTEEMIAQLGRLDAEHLGVIARTSVMHYKHSQEPLEQIGRELGAQYVLEGSVRRDADKVRITAQLIQIKDQAHVWTRQYDRQLSGLLALQTEIAQEVSDEIQIVLGEHKRIAPSSAPTLSPKGYEAYDLYLKGRYFWNKRTPLGFQQAVEYFQQAIAKDPNYARAYAGLADTFALMSTWGQVPQNEFMPKARAAALKALQIDESLAEAHTSLALIAENYDYDWQTAEKEYRRAIQLDASYATAHQWYAECLSFEGRFDEALAESERARQLDPLSLIIATDHGAILYFSRQYDRAIEQFRGVLEMEPNFTRAHMVVSAYVEEGRFADALTDIENLHRLLGSGSPYVWALQVYVYGRWGRREQARHALKKFEQSIRDSQWDPTPMLLTVYAGMNRRDEAIALLQKASSEHSSAVITLKVEPMYDALRKDPRFQDLLRRVGP